jgi:hypothetical protein
MTDAQTHPKEAEFKQRFVAILDDVQRNGLSDGEAMATIGMWAHKIASSLGQSSWSGVKSQLNAATYDELLSSFQSQGNALHQQGKQKQAYALQVLAASLVVGTQRSDKDLAAGEKLLDAVTDHAEAQARNFPLPRTN